MQERTYFTLLLQFLQKEIHNKKNIWSLQQQQKYVKRETQTMCMTEDLLFIISMKIIETAETTETMLKHS